ncbi:MAG TPA: hypothetical protein VHP31_08600 [Caproicibacter sp.]|nr:hypothetical protein [Caproicibacter sp.]
MKRLKYLIFGIVMLIVLCSCSKNESSASKSLQGAKSNVSSSSSSSGSASGSSLVNIGAQHTRDLENGLYPVRVGDYTLAPPNRKNGWDNHSIDDDAMYFNYMGKNYATKDTMYFCADAVDYLDNEKAECNLNGLDNVTEYSWKCMSLKIGDTIGSYLTDKELMQKIESKQQVKINNFDMLKVTGRIKNSVYGQLGFYYTGYYTIVQPKSTGNNHTQCPIFWMMFSHSKANMATMNKTMDAMAKTLELDKS